MQSKPRLPPAWKAMLTVFVRDVAPYLIDFDPSLKAELGGLPEVIDRPTSEAVGRRCERAFLRSEKQLGRPDGGRIELLYNTLLHAWGLALHSDQPRARVILVLKAFSEIEGVSWGHAIEGRPSLCQLVQSIGAKVKTKHGQQTLWTPHEGGVSRGFGPYPLGTFPS